MYRLPVYYQNMITDTEFVFHKKPKNIALSFITHIQNFYNTIYFSYRFFKVLLLIGCIFAELIITILPGVDVSNYGTK